MEMLTNIENIKQKTEFKMFDNLVTNNSNLLISVEGHKDRQNITTVDLIKNCKLKKKILDRSWKEVDHEKMFKPQETTLELNRQRYQGESSEDRQQNNMSTNENQIAGGSSKILEAKHMVNPKYGKKKSLEAVDQVLDTTGYS